MADHEAFLLDKRTIDRNIQKGLISRKDYEKHLADLKDVEDNAEVIDFGPAEEAADEAAVPAAAPAAVPAPAAMPAAVPAPAPAAVAAVTPEAAPDPSEG